LVQVAKFIGGTTNPERGAVATKQKPAVPPDI